MENIIYLDLENVTDNIVEVAFTVTFELEKVIEEGHGFHSFTTLEGLKIISYEVLADITVLDEQLISNYIRDNETEVLNLISERL